MNKTQEQCIFISATQNRNTSGLREMLFTKVRELYLARYPHRAGYWHEYLEGGSEVTEGPEEK